MCCAATRRSATQRLAVQRAGHAPSAAAGRATSNPAAGPLPTAQRPTPPLDDDEPPDAGGVDRLFETQIQDGDDDDADYDRKITSEDLARAVQARASAAR